MMLRLMLLAACSGPVERPTAEPSAPVPDPIRIGWQTTWATQGQLAMVLMKTNILELAGFDGEFVGFSYGGPLNEGALAGEVDVLFTADQPALSLASKAPGWGVVGRLMFNRVGTFVPPDSPVQEPGDLRGRTVAIPFGAAAHRETLAAVSKAGLDPVIDVRAVNLGLEELVALVGAGSKDGRWGEVDAGSAWDPAFADLEHSGKVRVIASSVVTSVVAMDDAYAAAHPGADQRFMGAVSAAWDWYRQHPEEANRWFKDHSRLPFDEVVLEMAASVEPNLAANAARGVRVNLDGGNVTALQGAADFMVLAGLLRDPLDVSTVVRPTAARRATPPPADQVVVR